MPQDKALWKDLPHHQMGMYRKYRDGLVEIQVKIRSAQEITALVNSLQEALAREFELASFKSQKGLRPQRGTPLTEVKVLRPAVGS